MTVDELLTELSRLSVKVTINEDRLHIDAPAGVLTPELRAALAEHKALLLQQLSLPGWSTDLSCQLLRIPLSLDQPPSAWLAERGLRIVGGDHDGVVYVTEILDEEAIA
jgi:hypothetical protein